MPKFTYEATRFTKDENGDLDLTSDPVITYEVDAIDRDDATKQGNTMLNEVIKDSPYCLDDYIYKACEK